MPQLGTFVHEAIGNGESTDPIEGIDTIATLYINELLATNFEIEVQVKPNSELENSLLISPWQKANSYTQSSDRVYSHYLSKGFQYRIHCVSVDAGRNIEVRFGY